MYLSQTQWKMFIDPNNNNRGSIEHLIPQILVVLFIKKRKKNVYPITLFIECQSYCVYIWGFKLLLFHIFYSMNSE